MEDEAKDEDVVLNWVIVDSVDIAKEVIALENDGLTDSDLESDGISVISDLHESTTEEELLDGTITDKTLSEICTEEENITKEKHEDQAIIKNSPTLDLNTKWAYIDSESKVNESESSNKFYLNCLQEPVQELLENELGSLHSDPESDRASIISEVNESVTDGNKCLELLSTRDNQENKINEFVSRVHAVTKKYLSNSMAMGIIILLTSILLGHYLVEPMEDDSTVYTDNDGYDSVQQASELYGTYYESDMLENCMQQEKNDIYMECNVKNCLKKLKAKKTKQIDSLKKTEIYLKAKQRFLEIKEKELLKKENELMEAEKNNKKIEHKDKNLGDNVNIELKQHYEEKNQNYKNYKNLKRNDKNKNNKEMKKYRYKNLEGTNSRNQKDNGMDKEPKQKRTLEETNKIIKKRKDLDKNKNKETDNEKYKIEIVNHNPDEFFDSDDEQKWIDKVDEIRYITEIEISNSDFKTKVKKIKHYKEKNKRQKYVEKTDTFNNKGFGKKQQREKKSKHKNPESHWHRKNEVPFVNLKNIKREPKNYLTKTDMNWLLKYNPLKNTYQFLEVNATKDIILNDDIQNKTINGQWFSNLYKNRNEIRNKQHLADWYFDRAYYRRNKRNKAKWYFDWMGDREEIRYRYTY